MIPRDEVFDTEVERLLSRVRVCGKRFKRPLLPEGSYVGGWERGVRFNPGNQTVVLFRWVLIDWPVGGVRIDVGARKGSPKCRAIFRALEIGGWDSLPVSRDECCLIQVLDLTPVPGLGSCLKEIRPAGPADVHERTDKILAELEREGL